MPSPAAAHRPTRPTHPAHPTRRTRRRITLVVGACAATAVLGLTGCSVDASSVDPETKTFAYDGERLNLTTNEVATKVIVADRKDIKVTRWFDSVTGTKRLKWQLDGDTLDIDAGCTGIAICDAKFEVEVPEGLAVRKDGKRLQQGAEK